MYLPCYLLDDYSIGFLFSDNEVKNAGIMTDRRRVNGPPAGTAPPALLPSSSYKAASYAKRTRATKDVRKICGYRTAFPATTRGDLARAFVLMLA